MTNDPGTPQPLASAQTEKVPNSYRDTVRRIGAAREKRLAELRAALQEISELGDVRCYEAPMIARRALALPSTDTPSPDLPTSQKEVK